MNDVLGVKVLNAFDDLVNDKVYEFRIQTVVEFLYEVEQVVVEVLEDEVDLSFFLECFLDADHVLTLEHLEHFDFSLYGLLGEVIFVTLLKLLDGNSLPE